MYKIKTYNAISGRGLTRFDKARFEVNEHLAGEDAILLRSFKLDIASIPDTVKAVARAGAGVNNVPVNSCTAKGIVVFNTPGANANAVKELVVCGLLLASRGIVQGIRFANEQSDVTDYAELSKLMEQEKKRFSGFEIAGKTLGVVGLGAIGSLVAKTAIDLGMNVLGYDPALSVEAAWRLPAQVKHIKNLSSLMAKADFVTLHLPVLDSTRGLISAEMLAQMKPGSCLLNFSRDEIVDPSALAEALESAKLRLYVCDFPRPEFMNRPEVIAMPHLGASTEEAEENCAIMAADQLVDFLENGNIKNSVNFPNLSLERAPNSTACTRLAISNKNVPKILGQVLSVLADQNINVLDMLNKSRGEIAYNLIDLESQPSSTAIDAILAIEEVIQVTLL
ncbi:MAG: D-3-phosphoglycerate dehydrogenase [Pseudohongiellaceae bacterium]|jgi:D-3-phosphoglycerate dehydrogenase